MVKGAISCLPQEEQKIIFGMYDDVKQVLDSNSEYAPLVVAWIGLELQG